MQGCCSHRRENYKIVVPTQKALICPAYMSFKDFIYLFSERGEGREKEGERNIDQLPLVSTPMRTKPTIQACALTGNRTHGLSLCRMTPNQLSHTGQGCISYINVALSIIFHPFGSVRLSNHYLFLFKDAFAKITQSNMISNMDEKHRLHS